MKQSNEVTCSTVCTLHTLNVLNHSHNVDRSHKLCFPTPIDSQFRPCSNSSADASTKTITLNETSNFSYHTKSFKDIFSNNITSLVLLYFYILYILYKAKEGAFTWSVLSCCDVFLFSYKNAE
jgi:hypothetical protein